VSSDEYLSNQKVSFIEAFSGSSEDMDGEGSDGEDEIGDFSDHHFCDENNAVQSTQPHKVASREEHFGLYRSWSILRQTPALLSVNRDMGMLEEGYMKKRS